ncbi:Importin nuclear transport [Oopsacas minuta]|uniref:Importin nuclear transport n=1 Tax=Oopsacas minuta TaxID=111878 RepID=A0AAV7KC21_9METZ|nr:Importin nuclear transport [Oopsacas minuta]
MDPALLSLSEFLNQTLSADDSIRRPAEQGMESLHTEAGYSLLLLKLIQESSVSSHISQAAAIAFKNFVKRYWDPVDENDCISLQDRLVYLCSKVTVTVRLSLLLYFTFCL